MAKFNQMDISQKTGSEIKEVFYLILEFDSKRLKFDFLFPFQEELSNLWPYN